MLFDFLAVLVIFVFKFVVVLFLVVEETKCIYRRLHLSRKSYLFKKIKSSPEHMFIDLIEREKHLCERETLIHCLP